MYGPNFYLQNQYLNISPNEAKRRMVALFREFTGKDIEIPKSIATTMDFDTKIVDNLQNIQFFKGAQLTGGTNQPQGYYRPQDEHRLITAIQVFQTTDVTTDANNTAFEKGLITPTLYNGTLSVNANGVDVLKNIPLNWFQEIPEQGEQGMLYLAEPILWQGQTQIDVAVNTTTVVVATNIIFMKINLIGFGFVA